MLSNLEKLFPCCFAGLAQAWEQLCVLHLGE